MPIRSTLVGLVILGASTSSVAQPGPWSRPPDAAVSAGVAVVHFGPDDPEIPSWFEVSGVAPTIAFTQPGMSVVLMRATDRAILDGAPSSLSLVDATVLVYNDLRLFGPPVRNGIEALVPIAITTTWRRIEQTRDDVTLSLFEYQTLGLGTGIGARSIRRRWIAEARATPSIGLATRSFGGSVGFTWGIDAGLWVNTGPLVGPVGLSVGYGFSWKRWRVGGPEAVAVAGAGRFNYTGHEHAVRLGFSW